MENNRNLQRVCSIKILKDLRFVGIEIPNLGLTICYFLKQFDQYRLPLIASVIH